MLTREWKYSCVITMYKNTHMFRLGVQMQKRNWINVFQNSVYMKLLSQRCLFFNTYYELLDIQLAAIC